MLRAVRCQYSFVVLWRAFLAEFFTTELATTDIQLRQVMIWVLAFLVTPGLFVLLHVGFLWDRVVTQPDAVVADLLSQLGVLFVTHSIVSVGVVAVLVWDVLSFSRRDAMVLGPLPLGGWTIVAAKLAALATFLVGVAVAINLPSATLFALMTGSHYGISGVCRHFAAHLISTVGAGVFVFGAVVTVRGVIALAGGLPLATWIGSTLQFLFVGVLLWFLIAIPSVMTGQTPWMLDASAAAWLPTAWFLGIYDRLLGFGLGAVTPVTRALSGLVLALCSGTLVIGLGFSRQMRLALAPPATPMQNVLSLASVRVARWLAGRDRVAKAIAEFFVVTLARNRSQQAPIVLHAAIGLAIVVAGLSTTGDTLDALRHPRVAVLWIPLVFAYWICLGTRAACFLPAELPAAWAFRVTATNAPAACFAATRAAMLTYVMPRILILTVPIGVLLGWRIAATHALFVAATTVLFVQLVAQTIAFVPFTREYRPGRARLRIWWPAYAAGLFLFAYLPARVELAALASAPRAMTLIAAVVLLAFGAAWISQYTLRRVGVAMDSIGEDPEEAVSLGITGVAPVG